MNDEFPLAIAATSFGDRVAYQDAASKITYTQLYKDVVNRAEQLATVKTNRQRFAFCPRNNYATLADLWAIWLAGATACPISHRFPDDRRRHIANTLDAVWLPEPSPNAKRNPVGSIDLAHPASIILSSGSSGNPKAIVHTLAAHLASARGSKQRVPLSPGDVWLWSLPAFHVGGLSIPIRCADSGATVYGVVDSKVGLDKLIVESKTTHVSLVPTQLQRLLDNGTDLSSLKAALLGGMAVPSSLIRAAIDRGTAIHTTYGTTETASQVATTSRLESVTESNGQVLPHCEIRIADDDEILVRGKSLCVGILRDGNIESIVDQDGWFHTRDRGKLNERNELVVLGRMDNMFISGGENIHPEAIERAILNLPNVKQAIVVPVQDQEFGARPVAFVEATDLASEEWDNALREVLAGFEIPTKYLPWPNEAMLAIKPDRQSLRVIANKQNS